MWVGGGSPPPSSSPPLLVLAGRNPSGLFASGLVLSVCICVVYRDVEDANAHMREALLVFLIGGVGGWVVCVCFCAWM